MANRNIRMSTMFLNKMNPNALVFHLMDVSATAGKRIPSEEKPMAPTSDRTGDKFGTAIAMATETTSIR